MSNKTFTPTLVGYYTLAAMKLLQARDNILRSIHAQWLKPLGYSLRSKRSERHDPPMHSAVALLSFSTNTADWVDFDITICATHEEYTPYKGIGIKSGLGHKDVQLISWGLSQIADPKRHNWSLRSESEVLTVTQQVWDAFFQYGLPLLERMSSLEGIVSLYAERGDSYGFQPRSWALIKLGARDEAIEVTKAAIAAAPHDNARNRATLWLAQIGG
jgi:hypothetical protein